MPPSPAAFKPCCPLEKPCLPLRDLAACSPTRDRTCSGSVVCCPSDPQEVPRPVFFLPQRVAWEPAMGSCASLAPRGSPPGPAQRFPAQLDGDVPALPSPPAPGTPNSSVSSPFRISSHENREGFHQGIWGRTLEPRAPGPFVHREVPLASPLPAVQPGRLPA